MTSSSFLMLHLAVSTLPSLPMASAAVLTLLSSLEAITTLAPRDKSSSEMALPIPVPPPRTSENVVPKRCIVSKTCHYSNFVSKQTRLEN